MGDMDSNWLMEILASSWASIGLAYIFGVLTGWTVWGVALQKRLSDQEASINEETQFQSGADAGAGVDASHPDESMGSKATSAAKKDSEPGRLIDALETEIKNAKALLAAEARRSDLMGEIADELDGAVKRANGRLKLLAKSLKNNSNSSANT